MRYPFVIEPAPSNLAASAVQFATLATAKERSKLERLMAEQLALVLYEYTQRGEAPPAPADASTVDLSEYEEGSEVVYIRPAPLNPISLKLEAEIERQGITQSELARRMNTPRSVISRLTNPFYWGHSLKSLNEVAQALNVELEVSFEPPDKRRQDAVAAA